MLWTQIKDRYIDQWVLLDNVEIGDDMEILGGDVIYVRPNKDNVYRKLLEIKPKKSAIEFVGDIPEDIAMMITVQNAKCRMKSEGLKR